MTTTELQESISTEKKEFELIKGDFTPNEAMEILTHLIQEKINFHNMRNFSRLVRTGSEDDWSQARVEALKKSREVLKVIIDQAKAEGKTLNIKSNITIEVK